MRKELSLSHNILALKNAKTALLIAFSMFSIASNSQSVSSEFESAQAAIEWAQANTTTASNITHIIITGNNSKYDLLKLKNLNNNSKTGPFNALESLELSTETDTIPTNCFYSSYSGAQWLKHFSAPNLSHIDNWAFRGCTSLATINLPSVLGIGSYAFYNSGLTEIELPASFVTCGSNPFLGCQKLKKITVNTQNKTFKTESGVLYNFAKTILIAYPAGKPETTFALPNITDTVGNNAFGLCQAISMLEFQSPTNVEKWICEYCTGLATVKFGASEAINVGTDAFRGVITEEVELYLKTNGFEFNNNVSGSIWKGYEWKSVRNETFSDIRNPDTETSYIRIYPNAVKDILNIETNDANAILEIYDLQSRLIYKTIMLENTLNISFLPIGMYVVKVTTYTNEKRERILKTN